ncbi:hypothetical protein 10S11_1, partial [uncultured Caudovirales phage]
QIKIKENKKYDEQIRNRVKSLQKYCFKYKGLVIRPAESSKELIKEGAALNHCVATHYTKSYAKGVTNILLIRKEEEPNKPYYTVEIRNNNIIQVHGKGNCIANNEVKEFIEVFKESKLKQKNRNISKSA